MDPLNQFNVMHIQEPLNAALDLSMGCKQIPGSPLDLVKKASQSDCNSGTNDVVVGAPGARSERHVSKPFKQVQPDVLRFDATSEFSYESRCSSVSLLKGLPPVTETHSQCPTSNSLFTEDDRAGAEMDKALTHPSECPRIALIAASENTKTDTPLGANDSTEGAKNLQNGLNSQPLCHGKCAPDTVSARTRSRGAHVLQNSTSFASSLHSTGSASFITSSDEWHPVKNSAVETRSCKQTGSGKNSPCSVECISSDDSDVIEVPVSNSIHRQTGLLLTGSVAGREMSQDGEKLSSLRQGFDCADGMAGSAPQHMAKNGYHANERGFRNPAVELDESSSPAVLLDSDPETESVSKNLPSTSDTENAERNLGALSPSLSLLKDGPQGAPESKRKNQSRARPKRSRPGQLARLSPGSKEAASAAKRRRRKARPSGSSSVFAPQEPEIKLKYANYKEERREGRDPGFAPYVRVELSTCTIVNFREEDDEAQAKKGRQAAGSCVSSGVVPTTSRLVLGRSSAGSRTDQICCLCGKTSDASGLGDLHGPYYLCGPHPNTKIHRHAEGGGTHGPVWAESPLRVGGVLDSEETSPSKQLSKQCSTEERPGAAEAGGDCGERWVHEDCSVWSTGVFLVKGKLYGLEEALRLTRETVCSCCHSAGATLGCFFKGCPNKYHFPCAVQADCMLSEENFTMRCPKHKVTPWDATCSFAFNPRKKKCFEV